MVTKAKVTRGFKREMACRMMNETYWGVLCVKRMEVRGKEILIMNDLEMQRKNATR